MLETIRENQGVEAVYCSLDINKFRVKFLKIAKEYGLKTPNYVHSSVNISPNVTWVLGRRDILLGTSKMSHMVSRTM